MSTIFLWKTKRPNIQAPFLVIAAELPHSYSTFNYAAEVLDVASVKNTQNSQGMPID
jgi:hypothetical protein